MNDATKPECGIASATYARTAIGLEPTLFCLCGYATSGADTWEEAGADLDAHLEADDA